MAEAEQERVQNRSGTSLLPRHPAPFAHSETFPLICKPRVQSSPCISHKFPFIPGGWSQASSRGLSGCSLSLQAFSRCSGHSVSSRRESVVIRKHREFLTVVREQCETLGRFPRIGVLGTPSCWLSLLDTHGWQTAGSFIWGPFREGFWVYWPNYSMWHKTNCHSAITF